MDSNITENGEPIKDENSSDYALKTWIMDDDYVSVGGNLILDWNNCNNMSIYGPITAMNYLEKAVENWSNLNPMEVSKFTDKDNNIYNLGKIYTTYARLPYLNEVGKTGCDIRESDSDFDVQATCPGLMVDYLEDEGHQTNIVSNLDGYCTFATWNYGGESEYYVSSKSYAVYDNLYVAKAGVRPVITLEI